jgi:DNA gyrase/topoisomerase IV subunit A
VDKLIPVFYKSYGEYVNHFRAFPLDLDGLKPVERRILLSTYEIARDKYVKSARIDGHCIGHYHPHGSSYSTIVQLVNQGFLDGQGNFGSSVGVDDNPPAAMRYTECRLSKKTVNMAFKLLDYVPWVESELDKEPEYLPTMFPFCIIGHEYTVGIGFGYRTYIPCYSIEDLHKRLLYLLKKEKTKPSIKPISDCDVLATDQELEELLTTGKASIRVRGKIKVDNAHCKVVVKSWPPGRKFESFLSKFTKELENQDIGFTDLSTSETNIVFEVLKQRNRDEIFKNFVEKLKDSLTGSISFETIIVDRNKRVRNIPIDEMIVNTYHMFEKTNEAMLKSEIERVDSLIQENLILEKIKPALSSYLQPKKVFKFDEAVATISDLCNVDEKIVRELMQKYRISKLLTTNTDIKELEGKKEAIKNNLNNLSKFVLNQYKEIGHA